MITPFQDWIEMALNKTYPHLSSQYVKKKQNLLRQVLFFLLDSIIFANRIVFIKIERPG